MRSISAPTSALADYGISDEAVMRLVGEAEEDGVVHFASYLAPGAYRGRSVDFGSHVDF